MEWASSDYEMTDAQKTVATELVEQWNGTIGPKFDEYYETAQRLHALGQSTETVEMLLLQAEIMDTLATKVSGVRSAFSGAGNALPLVPQIRGALEPKTAARGLRGRKTRWALPSAARARPCRTRWRITRATLPAAWGSMPPAAPP